MSEARIDHRPGRGRSGSPGRRGARGLLLLLLTAPAAAAPPESAPLPVAAPESAAVPVAPPVSLELPAALLEAGPPLPETLLTREEAASIRAEAERILRLEAYRRVHDEAPEFDSAEEMTYYLRRLSDWLQSLGATAQWAIVSVCLILLAAIGWHIFSVLRRVLITGREVIPAEIDLEDERPDPALELQRARDAAAAGEHALAMRHLHRYLRLELARRHILPYQPSWTNWEYLEALARTPLPQAPLRAFTLRCDRVFYGDGRGTEEDYRAALEGLEVALHGPPSGRQA